MKKELKKYRLLKSKFETNISVEDYLLQLSLEKQLKKSPAYKVELKSNPNLTLSNFIDEHLSPDFVRTKSQLNIAREILDIFDNTSESFYNSLEQNNINSTSLFNDLPVKKQKRYFDFVAPPSYDPINRFHIKNAIHSHLSGQDDTFNVADLKELSGAFYELIKEELKTNDVENKTVLKSYVRDKIVFFKNDPSGIEQASNHLKNKAQDLFPKGFVDEFKQSKSIPFKDWLDKLNSEHLSPLIPIQEILDPSATLYNHNGKLVVISDAQEDELNQKLIQQKKSIIISNKDSTTKKVLGSLSLEYDVLSALNSPGWPLEQLYNSSSPSSSDLSKYIQDFKKYEDSLNTPTPLSPPEHPKTTHEQTFDSLVSSITKDLSLSISTLEEQLKKSTTLPLDADASSPIEFSTTMEKYIILQSQLESFNQDLKTHELLKGYGISHTLSPDTLNLFNSQLLKSPDGKRISNSVKRKKSFPLVLWSKIISPSNPKSIFSPHFPNPSQQTTREMLINGTINKYGRFTKQPYSKTKLKLDFKKGLLTPNLKSRMFFKKLKLPNWNQKLKTHNKVNISKPNHSKKLNVEETNKRNAAILDSTISQFSKPDVLDIDNLSKTNKELDQRFTLLKDQYREVIEFPPDISYLDFSSQVISWENEIISRAQAIGIKDHDQFTPLELNKKIKELNSKKKPVAKKATPTKKQPVKTK